MEEKSAGFVPALFLCIQPRWYFWRWITDGGLAVVQKRFGVAPEFGFVGREDGLTGVLGQIDAAHFVCDIGTAAVKDKTGEDGDTTCGDDDGDTGIAAEVADFVIAAGFDDVVNPRANATAGIGQEVDGAVFFAHVVEGAPAGEVGFVVGITDIT